MSKEEIRKAGFRAFADPKNKVPETVNEFIAAMDFASTYSIGYNIVKENLWEIDDTVIIENAINSLFNIKLFEMYYKEIKDTLDKYFRFYKAYLQKEKEPPKKKSVQKKKSAPVKKKSLPVKKNAPATEQPFSAKEFFDLLEKNKISFELDSKNDVRIKEKCISKSQLEEIKKAFPQIPLETTVARGVLNYYFPVTTTALKMQKSAQMKEPVAQKTEEKSADKPKNSDTLKKDNVSLDDDLRELLQDEKYSLLREALCKEGITDIKTIRTINLWDFMNIRGLYSIQLRQSISDELSDKLRKFDKPVTENSEIIYEIEYGDMTYSGDTPSEAFLHFLSAISAKYPLKIRKLINVTNSETSEVVLKKDNLNNVMLRLQNPEVYIAPDLTLNQVSAYISWIISRCEAVPAEFAVQEVQQIVEKPILEEESEISGEQSEVDPACEEYSQDVEIAVDKEAGNTTREEVDDEIAMAETANIPAHTQKIFPSSPSNSTRKAEDYLLSCDLNGASYDDLQRKLKQTMVGVKEAVAASPHIIELNQRLYHEDVFVDFEEGADMIESILDKLLKKNNGNATAVQLYEYACSEMSMFMNDNNITEQREIYDLARYLFEKLEYHGKNYYFYSNKYISLPEVRIESILDIIKKYARERGSTITFDEIEKCIKGLGLNSGNLRGMIRIDKEPIFLIYKENEYLLAELIHIDDYFMDRIRQALNRLFADENEFIIIRNISDSWYNLLPELPAGLDWTPMLLQQFLHFYTEKLEARTIIAMDSQYSNTLHTVIVKSDSWIQNFRDVVAVFLSTEMPERQSFEAEDLRKILARAGMIYGNQLIGHMHIALGSDSRFIWDRDGQNVKVRW